MSTLRPGGALLRVDPNSLNGAHPDPPPPPSHAPPAQHLSRLLT